MRVSASRPPTAASRPVSLQAENWNSLPQRISPRQSRFKQIPAPRDVWAALNYFGLPFVI
jgi:hypothetical protein